MEAYSTLLNVDVEAASKLAAFIAELLPEDAKEAYFEECSSLVQQSRSYDLLVKFLDQSGIILTSDADAEAVFQGMVSIIFTIEDQKQATQITERLLKELTSNNDNSRLCLRILVSLLNLFVTPITKFAALQTILAFASTSKQEVAVSHLSVSVVQWSADWNLSSDQKRDLFAAMASVLAAAKQTAKSLSFSLLVLQVSCASAADVSTIIKTAMELPPAEAPLRNEVFTVVTSYCKSVTSDAAVAPLLQLLQCVSEGDVKGFKSFAALVTSLGADAEAKARRTLLIMSLCRAIAAQGKGSACTVSYATAAAALDLSINEQQKVESWIVDAVGAGVLDASLNQIEQCINVTRCLQPAFGKQQWKELADQLNVWKTSALAVQEPQVTVDIFDQRIDDVPSDDEHDLDQKSDVGLESFEEYERREPPVNQINEEPTPSFTPEIRESHVPDDAPIVREVFPVDADIVYEEDLSSAVRVQRARSYSSAPVVDFAALIERGYREVVFEVPAVTRAFAEARTGQGKFVSLIETAQFLGRDGPPVLQIMKPTAELTLAAPTAPVSILQGAIQRINLLFQTGKDKLINCKVYLSSDYTAPANSGPELFWYPDISHLQSNASISAAMLQSPEIMDSVQFSPFSLNSSFQPAQPLVLWNTTSNSEVCCPIFIKSDVQGPIVLKARVEYVPKDMLKASVSREFVVHVNVVKPFSMNFNITSLNEAHSGVDRKQASTVVLCGEVVNVSACLDCVGSLGGNVEIASMDYTAPPPDSLGAELFSLMPSSTEGNLLNIAYQSCNTSDPLHHSYVRHLDPSRCIVLKKGEAYVGSVDVKCNSPSVPSIAYPPAAPLRTGTNGTLEVGQVSMGALSVRWRLDDTTMFLPHDYKQLLAQHTVPDPSKLLSWLPAVAADGDVTSALSSTQRSRVCSALFSIPAVKVVDAPFEVAVSTPTTAYLGEVISVNVRVTNKLWSLERISVQVELCDEFALTGSTAQVFEVAPLKSITYALSLAALECGQMPMPHVKAIWERSKTTVFEFGTHNVPKHIFIRPVGRGE